MGGGFPVGDASDGSVDSGSGWAIFRAAGDPLPLGTTSETAVWETATDVEAPGDLVRLSVAMHEVFTSPPFHLIGRFRWSVTTDERDTFADGLATGGDVTATGNPSRRRV